MGAMTDALRPVVAAYDGSPAAAAALRSAVELFPGRTVLVVSVWEPGLAMVSMNVPDPAGFTYVPPTGEQVESVDRAERDHAQATAQAGAAAVEGLGGTARALPMRDEADVADTIVGAAEQEDAAAIVIGSRGLGGLRSKVFGSTSHKVLHDARRPVVVVRADE
jgi:nucleotide-binding universal stress UspA family protein